MIFFFNADGALIKSAPDTVYQGSAEASKVYIVAPVRAENTAQIRFKLPNGEIYTYLLTNAFLADDITDEVKAEIPTNWGLWFIDLPSVITQYAGTLTAQVGIYQGADKTTAILTTQAVTITIARGVAVMPPEEPSETVYEQILAYLTQIDEYYSKPISKMELAKTYNAEYKSSTGVNVVAKGNITYGDGKKETAAFDYVVPIEAGTGLYTEYSSSKNTPVKFDLDLQSTTGPNEKKAMSQKATTEALNAETTRAKAAENTLTEALDAETTRAKAAEDTKLNISGGSITGDLTIGGNLNVNGTTTIIDSTTLKVKDKLIEVGSGNTVTLTTPAGLFTPKYDGTHNGGIVYDATGTAYVGDIVLDSNGNVDVENSDLQPIATRDDINATLVGSIHYYTLEAIANAAIAASPKVLRVGYTMIPTNLIKPPSGLNYGAAYYIFRVLVKPYSNTLGVIEVTFENTSTTTKEIRPIGYISQGISGIEQTWWWSGWTTEQFVTVNAEQTISGVKTFSSYIKTPQVANSNGNALIREKSTEGKSVFGNDSTGAVIMGNGDRPYYSKSGSDFVGEEIALLSDISGGSSVKIYLHALTLRIRRGENVIGYLIGQIISTKKESYELADLTNDFLKNALICPKVHEGVTRGAKVYYTDTFALKHGIIIPPAPGDGVFLYYYSTGYPWSSSYSYLFGNTTDVYEDVVTQL